MVVVLGTILSGIGKVPWKNKMQSTYIYMLHAFCLFSLDNCHVPRRQCAQYQRSRKRESDYHRRNTQVVGQILVSFRRYVWYAVLYGIRLSGNKKIWHLSKVWLREHLVLGVLRVFLHGPIQFTGCAFLLLADFCL